MKLYNQQIVEFRRKELRERMTSEERILWKMMRKYLHDARFRRQYSVGYFIIDFYSPKYRLGIELDGGQHSNAGGYDLERSAFLEEKNILILRFLNKEVREDLGNVMTKIKGKILVRSGISKIGSPL